MRFYVAVPLAVAGFIVAATTGVQAGEVYIPLGSDNKIVVVDDVADRIAAEITDLPAVHGLAGTPDGRYLIAGSYEERERGDLPSKPAGVSEEEHEAHHTRPAGQAQGTEDVVSTLTVLRTADGSVVRRIDVPGAVHHVAVSPDSRFAAVTFPNRDAIGIIDLETIEVAATVPTGALPNYAVFAPGGGMLYVSNGGDGTVSEVETSTWTVRRSARVGNSPEHVVMSPDGRTLYVNNVEDGTVSVLSLERMTVDTSIAVGSILHGIDLSDDGKTLFVAARGEEALVAVDLATGAKRSIQLAPDPYHLAVLRGTDKLYVSSAAAPIVWVVDQSSLEVIGEIPIGGKGHQMVQAPGR